MLIKIYEVQEIFNILFINKHKLSLNDFNLNRVYLDFIYFNNKFKILNFLNIKLTFINV